MGKTDENSSGGATDGEGGAQTEGRSADDQSTKPVKFEDHKRVLDDMHRHKTEAIEAKKRLKELEDEKLRQQNDFKSLADREKKRADDAESKLTKREQAFLNTLKYKDVQVAASKLGLRNEAEDDLGRLSLESIEVEATSEGRFIIKNADDFVANLKKTKPHWFKDQTAPVINAGGGKGGKGESSAKLTSDYMVELRMKDPKKYRELMPKYLEERSKQGA